MTRLPVVAILALFVLQACDGNSPTDPADLRPVNATNLIGTWGGPMPTGMAGEDWTSVTLTINHVGDGVAGSLRPQAGADHPVTVALSPASTVAAIHVLEPAADPNIPCDSYTILVSAIEYRRDSPFALIGGTVGKCPNTLIGQVRLTRR